MQTYQVIIFDFFGVIGKQDFYAAWLTAHGYKRENEFASVALDGDTGKISLKEYFHRLSMLSNIPAEEIQAEIESYIAINQDVVEIIKQLRGSAHYKIGLLSTAPAEILRRILKQYDLAKYFDETIISSDVGITKSDPHIFELMLDKIKVAPKQTIFIDDVQRCVDVARTVGITAIQFHNTDQLIGALKKLGVHVKPA